MRKINVTKKLILETAKRYSTVREFDNKHKIICRTARKKYGEKFYQKDATNGI